MYATAIQSVRLPAQFYDAQGRPTIDPNGEAERYVRAPDGWYGVQYPDGHCDWLGPTVTQAFGEVAEDLSGLAERIERVYMTLESVEDPRGARAWFARRAHSHPTTVSRWLSGAMSLPGPALGLLEEMERRAETSRPKR